MTTDLIVGAEPLLEATNDSPPSSNSSAIAKREIAVTLDPTDAEPASSPHGDRP